MVDPITKIQLPDPMSNHAEHVDGVFMFIFYLSLVLFVGIVYCMVKWSIQYRRKTNRDPVPDPLPHMPKLEAAWTIAPFFIVMGLFHYGFKGYARLTIPPANALQVRVFGSKWKWSFQYENGGSKDRLVVPINKPVKLIISSSDVLHAVYVPAFRIKRDAVPGQYSTAWFTATQLGKADLFCAEYCGGKSDNPANQTGHWSMHADVEVVTDAQFTEFLKGILGPQPGETLELYGKRMYSEKGCNSCHSVDGSPMTGPTWKGLYGKNEVFTDGSTLSVDDNYLRESVMTPNARIVRGFNPNVMPSYAGQLQEVEMTGIIKYIESLK